MWSALQSKLRKEMMKKTSLATYFQTLLIYTFFSFSLSLDLFFPVYILCRYNYKVNDVFREIMGVSGLSGCSGVEFSQSSRHKSKCNIL